MYKLFPEIQIQMPWTCIVYVDLNHPDRSTSATFESPGYPETRDPPSPPSSLRFNILATGALAAGRLDLVQRLHHRVCRQFAPAPDARALLCIDVQRVLQNKVKQHRVDTIYRLPRGSKLQHCEPCDMAL